MKKPLIFKGAKVVKGAGRGKGLGIPTVNIDLTAIPADLVHGIYACRITLTGKTYMGAMHYGPRPVFKDTDAFEVHIIDATIDSVPEAVDIEIVGYIREIADFPSVEALLERVQKDIQEASAMLST